MAVPKEYLSVLKKYFGHKEFRPMQWKIINSILNERKDNCVIMATGYGKSLCYQFPPVFKKGVGIVISPLISLMQDQVLALQVKNIPATLMGSAQKDKGAVMDDVRNGKFRLLYVTPEWCSSEYAVKLMTDLASSKTVNLTLVAIDEAHCVSQWGMDFRKAYRKLGELKQQLPGVPFLALTATATPTVQKDICRSLNLNSPTVTCTSFDRPNLFLSCSVKGESILNDIKSILRTQNLHLSHLDKGSCIIYCPTKKKVDEVAEVLSGDGIRCEMYHADLSLNVRERVHKDFVRDKVQIVVATVAFGMGIDKPDVRQIIHYGAPIDIETYYQEIGRAGRDGEQAHCHVFYQQSDFGLAKHFLSSLSSEYRSYKEAMTRVMQRYLQTSDCRRKIIVSHFDPSSGVEENSKCCDNCFKSKEKTDPRISSLTDYDLTEDALLLLNAIRETGGRYGLQVPIYLLRGSKNQKLPQRHHNSSLFSKGYDKPDDYWKLLGGLLQREFLLEDKYVSASGSFGGFPLKTVQVSRSGFTYIEKPHYRETYSLKPTPEMLPYVMRLKRQDEIKSVRPGQWLCATGSATTDATDAQPPQRISLEELVFEAMLKFRTKVAGELDCMPYMIFDNHTIQLLSRSPPLSIEELSTIEGFTEAKLEKFGSACLKCIEATRKLHENLLRSEEAGSANTKQFSKAKKVITYESDESGGEDGEAASKNNQSSNLLQAEDANPGKLATRTLGLSNLPPAKDAKSVTDLTLEDSFCDDDVFEGLANDDELISASVQQTAPDADDMDSQLCAEFHSDFQPTAEPRINSVVQQCEHNSVDRQQAATETVFDAAVSSEFETEYFSFTGPNSEQNLSPHKAPTERAAKPKPPKTPQLETTLQSKLQPTPQKPTAFQSKVQPTPQKPTAFQSKVQPTPQKPIAFQSKVQPTPQKPTAFQSTVQPTPQKPIAFQSKVQPTPQKPTAFQSTVQPTLHKPNSPDSPPSKRGKNSSGAPHYQPLNVVKTPAAAVIRQDHVRKNEMKKTSLIKKIKL